MTEKEKVIFEKFIDDHGAFLTSLSLEDNPEIIIAIIGENLNEGHPGPVNFEKKMSVSMPEKESANVTEVTIWFSDQTEDAVLAYVIQAFFDARFPDFEAHENTTMGISEPGKITVRQN
tara:strand:- start:233 stop:589 length:357 start_codon:yes stop_codon:yes gene_type:complete